MAESSSVLTMILVMRRIIPGHSFDHNRLCIVDNGLFLGCRIHYRYYNIYGRNTKREVVCHGFALKMTVIIRSPFRWVFVFVTLFLLLGVHATGVNSTTDRLVSVLARPLLILY